MCIATPYETGVFDLTYVARCIVNFPAAARMVDRKRIQSSFALYAASSTFMFASAFINLLNDSFRNCNSHDVSRSSVRDNLPPVEHDLPTHTSISSDVYDKHMYSQLPIMYCAVGFALTLLIGPMLAARIGPGKSILCVCVLLLPKYVFSLWFSSLVIQEHWMPSILAVSSGVGLGFFFALITRQTADIVVRMQNEHGLLASFNPVVSDADRRSIFCALSTLLSFVVAAIPLANGLFLVLPRSTYPTASTILTIVLLCISICTYLIGLREHQLVLVQQYISTNSVNLSRANLHVIISDIVAALVQFMHSYTSRVQKASILVIGILAFGFHEVFVYVLLVTLCSGDGVCEADVRPAQNNGALLIKNSFDVFLPNANLTPPKKITRLCEFAPTAGLSMGTCMVLVMTLCALCAWRIGSRRSVHDVLAVVLGCLLLFASYGLMFVTLNHNSPTTITAVDNIIPVLLDVDDSVLIELIMLLFAAGNALLRVTLYSLVFNVFQVHVCVGYSICLFLECFACVSWVVLLSPLLTLHWQLVLQSLMVLIMLFVVAVLERQDRRLRHLANGLY